MNISRRAYELFLALCCFSVAGTALAQTAEGTYTPLIYQEGKDVVWVPTPQIMVEKMLDMAKVTPQDFVIDLGSGDGRNVIAAARRGARALGVEYNPDLVELSKRAAAKEGVTDRASFIQGDMYEADISQATVLALFLLTENLTRLTPKFLDLRPGTRIVSNHFGIPGWNSDESEKVESTCEIWCTSLLYIVPAKVEGTWRLAQGELVIAQKFQMLSGTLSSGDASTPIANGRLRGDQISFSVGGRNYEGHVSGDTMEGSAPASWRATRTQ